jgi:hypothetical protein
VIDDANLRGSVWINRSLRSVDLEFANPPMLIRSRFRVSRVLEQEAHEDFEDHALSHFARHAAVQLPPERPSSIEIVFGERAVTAPVKLSTIVFASVNLEQLGMPDSAVDIALALLPDKPLGLLQVDDPTAERLLALELLRRLWPSLGFQ